MNETVKTINDVLNELRPFLMNDGGDIEFIKYEDGIVYILFQGACSHCQMREFTLKDSIERSIKDRISEIKEVKIYTE